MTQVGCPIGCATRCQPHEICWFNGCDDVESLIERKSLRDRERVKGLLVAEGRSDLSDELAAQFRKIDTGIEGARSTWSALSSIQRRVLGEAEQHGGRLERVGREYRHGARHQPYRPVYVATIRNLCSRDLMAWDGGAFDPEAAVVLTERGRFVLKHGETDA